jgi:hypothetical protein
MNALMFKCWNKGIESLLHSDPPQQVRRPRRSVPVHILAFEYLEDRVAPAILSDYPGISFASETAVSSLQYAPPDPCGAAGPSSNIEVVNQAIEIFPNKSTSSGANLETLPAFFESLRGDTVGQLVDPSICYDELIGRFIIGDLELNEGFGSQSGFDLAVSNNSNPTLSPGDWTFYRPLVSEPDGYAADYPGNFGYNADAFVFTLNMFNSQLLTRVQIISISAQDLKDVGDGIKTTDQVTITHNDINAFNLRPTTMHDSKPGDPTNLATPCGW